MGILSRGEERVVVRSGRFFLNGGLKIRADRPGKAGFVEPGGHMLKGLACRMLLTHSPARSPSPGRGS